ncbi:MAG: FAD/NAD(P)-binding protein [Bdellovibrionales bacterium]|nr:FAD/NAD(P)-binding protein [Bdellovibrionales bacterium]
MAFKVVIIGSGPHGLITATNLLRRLNHDEIRIVDPNEMFGAKLLDHMTDCATLHLRSGETEHVDAVHSSLADFAERSHRTSGFARGRRPCVKLWFDHLQDTAERLRLTECRYQAWGTAIRRKGKLLEVVTTSGTLEAESVVLAMGQMRPFYPEWAARLRGHWPHVMHVFDNDFDGLNLPVVEHAIVVGGGITAAQTVARVAQNGTQRITYLTRRPLSKGEGVTSTLDWRDNQELCQKLCSLELPSQRDDMLRAEGDRGTIPQWELERLEQLQSEERVIHEVCSISHAIPTSQNVRVALDNGIVLGANQLVLATGFTPELQDWLVASARALGLPFYPDGVPLLERDFEWGRGSNIFLTGIHARRIAGPYAHNVVGAQMFASQFCARRWK